MDELINYLLKYGRLDQQQIALIKSKAGLIIIKKGDYFLKAGRIHNQLGFVTEGVLRVYMHDENGSDITRIFITENNFAINISSFNDEIPSEVGFEAISDCKILIFSKKYFTELATEIAHWNDIFLKITAAALTTKLKISNNMLINDAKTRYLDFLKIYPGLANKIPLSALASYLGITQSSLSRIRKSIR